MQKDATYIVLERFTIYSFFCVRCQQAHMKRTRQEFERFKKSFLKWQKILNCMDYRVCFEFKGLDNAEAAIIYGAGCELWATVAMDSEPANFPASPEVLAKHEAIHLLFAKFFELAENGTSRHRLREAEESVVRVLEGLL